MTVQPSGLPSPVQSLGSLSARNAALIFWTVAASSAAGICLKLETGSRVSRLR